MGWIIATVNKWQSSRLTLGNVVPKSRLTVLDAKRMSDIQRKGSDTKFYYTFNLANERDGKAYVEVADHWNAVTDAFDTAYASNFIILPVYPDDDLTRATVSKTIHSDDLVLAYPYSGNSARSYVYYIEGGNDLKRVLVNSTIENISGLHNLVDLDGNIYKSVTMNTLEWIIQNYRCTQYADGTPIPLITDDALWVADVAGAYCWYDHNESNKDIYGALYNWYALAYPAGFAYLIRNGAWEPTWRVPTVADYDTLVADVGGIDATAGGILKEVGSTHWDAPNVGALDSFGWRSIGSGNRFVDDHSGDGFASLWTFDDHWTADELAALTGRSVYLSAMSDDFTDWTHQKYGGMAVRLCRNV